MKEIKLRQPIWENGKLIKWYYWGYKDGLYQLPTNLHESYLFTDLQDSNKKDVYEGDILHDLLHTEQYFKVEWQEGGFRLKLLIPKLSAGGDEDIDTVGEMEIVGNVHQNPEFEAVE